MTYQKQNTAHCRTQINAKPSVYFQARQASRSTFISIDPNSANTCIVLSQSYRSNLDSLVELAKSLATKPDD